jgi:hypothetical protein
VASAESFPWSPDSSCLLDSLVHMAPDILRIKMFSHGFWEYFIFTTRLLRSHNITQSLLNLFKNVWSFSSLYLLLHVFSLISLACADNLKGSGRMSKSIANTQLEDYCENEQ